MRRTITVRSRWREMFYPDCGSVLVLLVPVRVWRAVKRLVLKLLADEAGVDQLVAQIFGKRARIALVLHDMRRDQHQQFGAEAGIGLVGEQGPQHRYILQYRDAGITLRIAVADQASHADGLPVLDRDPRSDQPLIEGRRIDAARRDTSDIADFLRDVERDETAGVDPRRHQHDDAGISVIDAVDDRRVGGEGALLALR